MGCPEQLAAARAEVAVMAGLRHPNLLPLLASALQPTSTGGAARQAAYLLFPLYQVRGYLGWAG